MTYHHRGTEGLRPTPRKARNRKVRPYNKSPLSLITSRCSAQRLGASVVEALNLLITF